MFQIDKDKVADIIALALNKKGVDGGVSPLPFDLGLPNLMARPVSATEPVPVPPRSNFR